MDDFDPLEGMDDDDWEALKQGILSRQAEREWAILRAMQAEMEEGEDEEDKREELTFGER